MKKAYITGAIILLVVISGSFAVYEHENSPEAKYQKGLSYYKEKNYKKALPLFEEAAKQGYAPAEEKLGHMYLKGWGVPPHTSKADYWLKKAINQGNAKAEVVLGKSYLLTAMFDDMFPNGKATATKYYQKALYLFKKAAEQGNAEGENYFGIMYDKGLGVPQDYSKADYWYKKAAKQGLAIAEYNIGYMYEYGLGVPKDYSKAKYWLKKAAEQGFRQAKRELEHLESEY